MTRRGLALLALVTLAALARIAYFHLADPLPAMEGLTRKYQVCAEHLLSGQGFMLQVTAGAEVPYVDRLPGYVVLLALLVLVVGSGTAALVAAHAVIASLQALALVALGRRLAGEAAGWAAGIGFALFPPLWLADGRLLETGATGAALAGTTWAMVRLADEPSWRAGWLLALFSSAALALRSDELLVPLVAVGLLAGLVPRRRWSVLLPALILPPLMLIPWGLRNARVADGFFFAAGLGNNLLQGYGEFAPADGAPYGDRAIARAEGHDALYWPAPATRDRARRDRALALIAEHPLRWAGGCLRRLPILASLHAGELWPGGRSLRDEVEAWRAEHPGRPRYEGFLRAALRYLRHQPFRSVGTLIWGPALWLLAGLGAWRLRGKRGRLLLLLALPAYGILVHLPLHAEPRYFLPHAGPLFVLAGAALLRERVERAVAAGGPLRLLLVLGAAGDARCGRRAWELAAEGAELRAIGFVRDAELAALAEPPVEPLGRLSHGRYGRRVLSYALALPRIRRAARESDVVFAFGSDLLLLCWLATRGLGGKLLVGELADVREALLGAGLRATLGRSLERFALRRAALVVTTSPELRRDWLIGRQGQPGERCIVIENKLDRRAEPRSKIVRSDEGPLRIGWFGLLRCRRSWTLLREALVRAGGALELVLAGIPRDFPELSAEAAQVRGVSQRGPFSSPAGLAALHAEVDVSWIAHAHGRGNRDFARANRFHEACFFQTPMIAQAGTPDAAEVEALGLGVVIDLHRPEEALVSLLGLNRSSLQAAREALAKLPAGAGRHGSEHAELLSRLGGLSRAIKSPAAPAEDKP